MQKKILPEMGLDILTEDNLDDVIEYINDRYEVPLLQASMLGTVIDDDLLKLAIDAITELTSDF